MVRAHTQRRQPGNPGTGSPGPYGNRTELIDTLGQMLAKSSVQHLSLYRLIRPTR